MMPIIWNENFKQWEVQDATGKPIWRGKEYADAVQFVEDYTKQQAFQSALQVGSVRG